MPAGASLPSLAIPHAKWGFLQASLIAKLTRDRVSLFSPLEREIFWCLGETTNNDQIKRAVLGIGRRQKALEVWGCVPFDSDSDDESDSDGSQDICADVKDEDEWSEFPVHVQKQIREIRQADKSTDGFEQQMLPLILSPLAAKEASESIAVDEETVQAVKRIVEHHHNPDNTGSSAGISRQQNTGGVLVYGPPGTGKTRLARLLASTTQCTVIRATAADFQSQYCGESRKIVKALFNLARRISPSIVFIDSADSLFGVRSPNGLSSRSSFYRETTTQLLVEMSGFSKSRDSPLVILATNMPTLLEPAVLRLVPNITYMGPPTIDLSKQIFRLLLKGEVLDPDVDINRLAQMTTGYSGSDIKSLCVKTTLMCDKFVESGEDRGKRLLTWALFEQVLTASWTAAIPVSRPLRDFAAKHDPSGLQQMQRDDTEFELHQAQFEQSTGADLAAGFTDSNEGTRLNATASGEDMSV